MPYSLGLKTTPLPHLSFLLPPPSPPPPPTRTQHRGQLNGEKLTDAAGIKSLTRTLEIVMSPETARRTTLARADTRALSRAASKRPAPPAAAAGAGGPAAAKSTKKQLLANLMDTYTKSDVLSIEESIVQHVEYTLARSRYSFDDLEAYLATGYSLRDRLIEAWNDTNVHFKNADPKRVYYLSMEFLMGRSLTNALNNLGVASEYKEALSEVKACRLFSFPCLSRGLFFSPRPDDGSRATRSEKHQKPRNALTLSSFVPFSPKNRWATSSRTSSSRSGTPPWATEVREFALCFFPER